MKSDAFRRALSSDAFREALKSDAFRQALASDAFREALRSDAFRDAMRSDAFRDALRNDAFRQALKSDAFVTPCGTTPSARAARSPTVGPGKLHFRREAAGAGRHSSGVSLSSSTGGCTDARSADPTAAGLSPLDLRALDRARPVEVLRDPGPSPGLLRPCRGLPRPVRGPMLREFAPVRAPARRLYPLAADHRHPQRLLRRRQRQRHRSSPELPLGRNRAAVESPTRPLPRTSG